MADEVPTAGGNVAADNIGDVFFQRMKITQGADGVNDGDVSSSNRLWVQGTFYQATQPVSLTSLPALSAGANVIGAVTQSGTWAFTSAKPSSGATTTVDDRDSPRVAILASNSSRLGATIYNDSTAALYLLLASGSASATNFTVKVAADGYYEVPFGYTGAIDGVWASNASGNARVTEFS
jgi:hypothetical protein